MDGFARAASSFERYGGIDRQNPGIGRRYGVVALQSGAHYVFLCGITMLLAKATLSVVISKSEIY
ncbi:hypothetical protein C5612_00250 [Pseudomonas frederiksbergensis]|uniref:Uncharacterized protein n=1 Tax=Pseudomonas frederiksbergensis TaxID=104087 RepID=A0A2S8HUM2_9PSED|nr:hypothetical protein C5612_00250 [Pseudomonas frederiksbergensis]